MSGQLREAMAVVGPEAVQRTRVLLLAAGDAAAADRSPKCLLYAGLATATADRPGPAGEPQEGPDPLLVGAVLTVGDIERKALFAVSAEFDDIWLADGDRLAYALALELLIACTEGWMITDRAREALEGLSDLGDWGGQ